MNQPSSLFYNFKTIFFSSIMSVNFYKYCHIILRIWSCILRIGMSVRRSSRSAFGRSTGNDVSGHYKRHYFLFSFSFFFSVVYFSHRRSARIKKRCNPICPGKMCPGNTCPGIFVRVDRCPGMTGVRV